MNRPANKSFRQTSIIAPLCLLVACFIIYSIASLPTIQAGGGNPNYADCMKNPFAPACRGISAKRSSSPPTNRAPATGADSEQLDLALNHWRAQMQPKRTVPWSDLYWLLRLWFSDALARQMASSPSEQSAAAMGGLYQMLANEPPLFVESQFRQQLATANGNE